MRQAVEAVATHPGVAPGLRHGIGRGLIGHARVECGVEHGDLRQAGPALARQADAGQRNRVVLGRQRGGPFDLALSVRVDKHGLVQAGSAVRDPMADGVDRRHAGIPQSALDLVERRGIDRGVVDRRLHQRHGRCRIEDAELERRAAGVEREDVHGPARWHQWNTMPSTWKPASTCTISPVIADA
jgi:hypothetical protein